MHCTSLMSSCSAKHQQAAVIAHCCRATMSTKTAKVYLYQGDMLQLANPSVCIIICLWVTLTFDLAFRSRDSLSETLSYLFHANSTDLSQLVRLNRSTYVSLDRNLGLRLLLSEITLLFDLDRTLAQRKVYRKDKSKVKVALPMFYSKSECR